MSLSYASASVSQHYQFILSFLLLMVSHGSHGSGCVIIHTKFHKQKIHCTVWQTLDDHAFPEFPLMKIWKNINFLWHVKFLVVTVNLSFSCPPHKTFLSTMGKNSGEISLILRLRTMKYNIILKLFSLREMFIYCLKHFIIKCGVHYTRYTLPHTFARR